MYNGTWFAVFTLDEPVVVLIYSWFRVNLISLCFKLVTIHYHTQKTFKKIKFKPRTKLNHDIPIFAMNFYFEHLILLQSMLQSAKVESFSHFTASKKRKADFAESLKHLGHNTSETKNPQFYSEMSKLILELENVLGMEGNVSGQETGLEQALISLCIELNIRYNC